MTVERPKFLEHTLGGHADGIYELAEEWHVDFFWWRITIFPGFTTDGASVPVLLRCWAGHPFDWPRLAAALAHDWLYASHVVPRWVADLIFLVILLLVGYPVWRSVTDWWAVSRFGAPAYNNHGPEDQRFARAYGQLNYNPTNPKERKKQNE